MTRVHNNFAKYRICRVNSLRNFNNFQYLFIFVIILKKNFFFSVLPVLKLMSLPPTPPPQRVHRVIRDSHTRFIKSISSGKTHLENVSEHVQSTTENALRAKVPSSINYSRNSPPSAENAAIVGVHVDRFVPPDAEEIEETKCEILAEETAIFRPSLDVEAGASDEMTILETISGY